MPQLTVLIPTYNCANYIVPAIKSVLAQKYSDYELLIIDDGSIDNTAEVISEIEDDRIIYIKNAHNKGIVQRLNEGIGMARGKYIARMDADDIILGNRLQLQVDFLEKNKEFGLIGGSYQVTNENGRITDYVEPNTDYLHVQLGLLFRNQFAHSAVTMRRELAAELLYDEEYIYTEDYDLWCRMSKITKVTNLQACFLSYRWHSANSCHNNQSKLKKNVFKILSRELDQYEIEYTIDELVIHAAICFGYGKKYFNSESKMLNLELWLDKVLNSEKLLFSFGEEAIASFKNTFNFINNHRFNTIN